jgi:tRNA(Ile)-lysidine synthase TilS/MesJ
MLPRVRGFFHKACRDFKLISPGDRIMVGLSGGKDSLTLCQLLCELRDMGEIPFEILCTHIQFSNIPYRCDLTFVRRFCEERRLPLAVVEDTVRQVHIDGVLRLACVHCARFRRAKLLEQTRLERCNKLAFGHHLDDIVATLLMNMSQHGKFAGMAVKLCMEVGEQRYPLSLIRPLCYISEDDIRAFAALHHYQEEKCRCGWNDDGVRAKVRETLEMLSRFDENARMKLFISQFRIGQDQAEGQPPWLDIEDAARSCPDAA